ncbi:MAG: glycosyltransferase [Pseudomonadota bacterium]
MEALDACNRRRGIGRYFETIWKTLVARVKHRPDIYLLGFRGHEIFLLIRLITIGKPLIFDEFMSPSDALVSEKKLGVPGRLIGLLIWPLEWLCLVLSRRCLTDTVCHKQFISSSFGISEKKIDVVYVGANTDKAHDAAVVPVHQKEHLSVLFYGTFLPLHGMDVLLRACKLIEGQPVQVRIIGGSGKALRDFNHLLQELELSNVRHDLWVDFDELQSSVIPGADLCLGGPFGGTPQARRVITGKAFQFLAQSKPTVIGRTDEPVDFIDRENCLLVEQGNAEDLASAISWAIENRSALPSIGEAGHELFQRKFSSGVLAEQLQQSLKAAL